MSSAPPESQSASWRWLIRLALTALGLGALGWFISQVDWSETRQLLSRLGLPAFLLVLPYTAVYLADTTGWWLSFARSPRVSPARFFRIRWAGEAVNNVVPSAYVGGEALKVLLLQRRGMTGSEGVTAAVLSKTFQSVAQLLFVALAAWSLISLGTAPSGTMPAMAVLLLVGAVLLVMLFGLQQRGLFVSAARLGNVVGFRWIQLEHRMKMLRTLDQGIREFRSKHPKKFMGSIGLYTVGWFLDITEVLLFAHLTDIPLGLRQALVLEVFTSLAKALAFFIPGAIGVQESGIVFVCRLAGVSPELGAAYALVRRAREVLFVLVGWKFLLLEQVHLRDLFTRKPPATTDPLST